MAETKLTRKNLADIIYGTPDFYKLHIGDQREIIRYLNARAKRKLKPAKKARKRGR